MTTEREEFEKWIRKGTLQLIRASINGVYQRLYRIKENKKMKITDKQSKELHDIDATEAAANYTLHVAMKSHSKILKQVMSEKTTVWREIKAEHELSDTLQYTVDLLTGEITEETE